MHYLDHIWIPTLPEAQLLVTSTYSSEFIAAHTCIKQAMDLCTTFLYMGICIHDHGIMFGNNQSMVDSSITLHAKLHKHHLALSFHHVHEAIVSKIVSFYHIPGDINLANILSKHWGYQQVWHSLRALLFWSGNPTVLMDDTEDA